MRLRDWILTCVIVFAACRQEAAAPPTMQCTADAALALYQRKIEPILKDDKPATCTQCHLSGVDLTLFVRSTPCQTMACLEQLGLVDLKEPEASTVLTWIGRAKPQSGLITAEIIQAEHEAFLDWIRYQASCGSSVCPTYTDACNEQVPATSTSCAVSQLVDAGVVDASDCRELALEQLFSSDVYAWRERCYPCHFTSDKTVAVAPKWITDVAQASTTPEIACASSALATMHSVLSLGLVDLQMPERSLLLQKPLAAPGSGIEHGGGQKFDGLNDPSYVGFLDWIQRYAACSARDPELLKAAPPPTAAAMPADAGPASSIFGYCNCMLVNCHDQAHLKWGGTDEELLAGCRTEALNVPANGGPTMTGNFLECRAAYCSQSLDDPEACRAALGQTICQ